MTAFDSIAPVSEGLVRIGGGVTYGQLAPRLEAAGWALPNLASLPHISVAGAISTGTHGSGWDNPSLAAPVSRIEFVDGTGEIRELARDDPEFDGAVVGLGAVGIVTALELEVMPTFEVAQAVFEGLSLGALEAEFEGILRAGYSVSLFTDWSKPVFGQVWVKSLDASALPDRVGDATAATEKLHPVPGMAAEACTEQHGVPGRWHERLPHFKMEFTPSAGDELQSEYLVPRALGLDAIRAVLGLGAEISPLLLVSEVRTVAADRAWMSPASGRDSLALHFTWKPEVAAVMAVLPKLEAALRPFVARPHWGKLFAMGAPELEGLYPRFSEFLGLAARYDPDGRFRNAFLEEKLFREAGREIAGEA